VQRDIEMWPFHVVGGVADKPMIQATHFSLSLSSFLRACLSVMTGSVRCALSGKSLLQAERVKLAATDAGGVQG
jgi:hypothetical protein